MSLADIVLRITSYNVCYTKLSSATSDNATVVVGTVIDPEMSDEIRVTVVATGLGPDSKETPLKVVESKPVDAVNPDYRSLDRPTVMRKNPTAGGAHQANSAASVKDKDMEYLDIPAFLRRQAD